MAGVAGGVWATFQNNAGGAKTMLRRALGRCRNRR